MFISATVTVYLTQECEGWMLSVDPPSVSLGMYPERGPAVLAARAATVARRGWLLVQMKNAPLQYLSAVEMATATIAGEPPPDDAVARYAVR
jgi:hypothetical protein